MRDRMALPYSVYHHHEFVKTSRRGSHETYNPQELTEPRGKAEGKAETLLRLLERRFHDVPETYRAQVLAAGVEQLDAWMADDERAVEAAFYGTARAAVRFQPKGVVGNIVPWNFPFDLSLGPMVEMLAAGNRVVIKPSDYTPACAALLTEMVAATFPEDRFEFMARGPRR